ncbi:hypothetical protein TTHERM_02219810 (macronuclear) [Tetrahymena thermophila SB210]|uniref:Uncharacterized protein n=1 Tax=Tetrahymena thermophila (strain SB210) TaxID=312017 RepID=Q225M3_TETTS|nr:hypothetical protein TTHERM_02219810 [Tetrahymena thermophila SB210]EAR80989.1 hypothetical protein TTHERM_02219810 [Tetrahymena thermophila SB210]|eukprot:XP_001028652.1 hypothetical protein TTHERM_02219810 [Tetrahymena thermophila SB210]
MTFKYNIFYSGSLRLDQESEILIKFACIQLLFQTASNPTQNSITFSIPILQQQDIYKFQTIRLFIPPRLNKQLWNQGRKEDSNLAQICQLKLTYQRQKNKIRAIHFTNLQIFYGCADSITSEVNKSQIQ